MCMCRLTKLKNGSLDLLLCKAEYCEAQYSATHNTDKQCLDTNMQKLLYEGHIHHSTYGLTKSNQICSQSNPAYLVRCDFPYCSSLTISRWDKRRAPGEACGLQQQRRTWPGRASLHLVTRFGARHGGIAIIIHPTLFVRHLTCLSPTQGHSQPRNATPHSVTVMYYNTAVYYVCMWAARFLYYIAIDTVHSFMPNVPSF